MEPLLEARDVGRRPENGEVAGWLLQDVSLALRPGEAVVLWGPSGAGKTVLLRCLCGLDPIEAGQIRFEGRPLADWPMPEYRSRVVYQHQRPVLFEGDVEENLRRVFRLRAHRARRFDRERTVGWLRALGRDEAFLGRRASDLSGGEQQIVALLRTLQLGPRVLLLDEPTASLDPEGAAAVETLIARWRAEDGRRACIWSSHDRAQAERVADRVVTLRDGRLADPAAALPEGRAAALPEGWAAAPEGADRR